MPKVDGKGMDAPKGETPQDSVDGGPHTGVPNEYKEGKIKTIGPNPGKGHVKSGGGMKD